MSAEQVEVIGASWHEQVPGALSPGHPVVRSEQVTLAPEPRNVSRGRHWVADRLPAWIGEQREVVMLLTSELVTNGVLHARTELVLGLAVTDNEVAVGVHDLDLGRQELPGSDRDGGRGLALVAGLAAAWGDARHAAGGKTYWFRVSV